MVTSICLLNLNEMLHSLRQDTVLAKIFQASVPYVGGWVIEIAVVAEKIILRGRLTSNTWTVDDM